MERSLYDYDRWPNFSKEELVCQCTGEENPNVQAFTQLMDFIQEVRSTLGVPIKVSSAYRSPKHPIEAAKQAPGYHTHAAIDIKVPTHLCWEVVRLAVQAGAGGLGVKLHGNRRWRFIHIDFRKTSKRVWSYP